jgi:antitoxin component of MazEF toxin-antitoxin module
MLTQKLIQIGTSVGLIVDKPLLERLEMKKGDEVVVELREDALVVTRLKKQKRPGPTLSRSARLAAVREELHADLGSAFRKLAK